MPLLPSTSSQATSGTTLQVRLATTVEVTTRQHSLSDDRLSLSHQAYQYLTLPVGHTRLAELILSCTAYQHLTLPTLDTLHHVQADYKMKPHQELRSSGLVNALFPCIHPCQTLRTYVY